MVHQLVGVTVAGVSTPVPNISNPFFCVFYHLRRPQEVLRGWTVGPIKAGIYRIWCGVNRLGDSGVHTLGDNSAFVNPAVQLKNIVNPAG